MIKTFIQIVNFFNDLSKQKILANIEIAEDNYYETLVISTETGFEIHLKRSVRAHVNNYNPVLLKVWEATQIRVTGSFFMAGVGEMWRSWVKMSVTIIGWWQRILKLHWVKCPKAVPKNEIWTRKWIIQNLICGAYFLILDCPAENIKVNKN